MKIALILFGGLVRLAVVALAVDFVVQNVEQQPAGGSSHGS